MRTSKTLSQLSSTAALVEDLDDTTLMSGHALLNQTRAKAFSQWMDDQLAALEDQFQHFSTPSSLRRSLGR